MAAAPLHIRHITNRAYICNILCSKTDILLFINYYVNCPKVHKKIMQKSTKKEREKNQKKHTKTPGIFLMCDYSL